MPEEEDAVEVEELDDEDDVEEEDPPPEEDVEDDDGPVLEEDDEPEQADERATPAGASRMAVKSALRKWGDLSSINERLAFFVIETQFY
jgi:hypothetical protein